MRASRLLTILVTLQVRGRATARTLAEQLEVSKRTIYRDIDELGAAGVPVYAERGPEGGFALLDGFRTQLTGLTEVEANALLLAGIPAAAADLGLAVPASSARLKLLAALPEMGRHSAGRVADRFHIDPVDWYCRPIVPKHLALVAKAVWEDQQLNVTYESWTRTSRRQIDPLGLVLKAGCWYLVARCDGTFRTYRLENIKEASSSGKLSKRPQDFELATFWRQNAARFEESLKRQQATLRVAASAMDRLYRLGANLAEPLAAAMPDAEGWRQASVPIESVSHAAGLLLGFADEIEVIEPVSLRTELSRRAARVSALYM